jgi:hypothetical protein
VSAGERAALARAKARLDPLALYPRPVRIEPVRLVHAPWLFRGPWFGRFVGYTMWNLILLRPSLVEAADDLIAHELVHVWQMQHRPLRMPLSFLRWPYSRNPYELQARAAVERTRAT